VGFAEEPSMADTSHAYNTVWQLRADAWCRLEEAADRLSRPTTPELKDRYVGIVGDLLTVLTPLEPYWAYPGSPQFARMQRLFAAGHTASSPAQSRGSTAR
jgi:arginine decarboxylase